jgi:ElaB/YqjD/DUF883 family membrane-anchored ribosome-binding protein
LPAGAGEEDIVETAENPPNGRAAAGDGTKKLGKRIETVGQTAEQVWDRTRDSFTDLSDALDIKGRVDRHPFGTVAAALGIGYVLGGGLFTPLTGRIVRMGVRLGMRIAVLPLLRQEIAQLVESIEDEDVTTSRGGAAKSQASKRTRTKGDEP